MRFSCVEWHQDNFIHAEQLLDQLCTHRPPRALIIVAHPDDEVIGAGSRLPFLKDATLVHVTDGAPRDLHDVHAAGFLTCDEYASARRHELLDALQLVGIAADQLIALNIPDKEAMHHLVDLTRALAAIIAKIKPDIVLTHPYEGGHPDHDSISFCVAEACALADRPPIIEMAFYHQGVSGVVTGEFLAGGLERIVHLSESEWELKHEMLRRFRSQKFLQNFSYRHERYRLAPEYDFSQPPHRGPLFYETLNWNITGARWREEAARARMELQGKTGCGVHSARLA